MSELADEIFEENEEDADPRRIAEHFEELRQVVHHLLRGQFFLDRLQELLCGLEKYGLQLKTLEPVFKSNGLCRVMLLEAMKHVRSGGTVLIRHEA